MSDEPHDRRGDDRRLDAIELELRKLTGEVGSIRSALGAANKTLLYDLDERYLTRKAAQEEFVPRHEHEQRERANKAERRDDRRQLPIYFFAAAGWITTLLQYFFPHH